MARLLSLVALDARCWAQAENGAVLPDHTRDLGRVNLATRTGFNLSTQRGAVHWLGTVGSGLLGVADKGPDFGMVLVAG